MGSVNEFVLVLAPMERERLSGPDGPLHNMVEGRDYIMRREIPMAKGKPKPKPRPKPKPGGGGY